MDGPASFSKPDQAAVCVHCSLRKGKTANLKKSRPKGGKSGGGKAKQRVQEGVAEEDEAGEDAMDIEADDREPGNTKREGNVGHGVTKRNKEMGTQEDTDGAVKMEEEG